MGESASLYWIFFDLIALTPLVLAVRFLSTSTTVLRTVLTLIGMYVYYLVGPRFVLFFLLYWVCIWLLQWLLISTRNVGRIVPPVVMTLALVATLAPMVWWKLAPDMFSLTMNRTFSQVLAFAMPSASFADGLFGMLIPLGLSFSVFRAIDLLIKVRIEVLEPVSLGRTLYYGFFPPILALGPIAEYEEVRAENPRPRLPDPGDLSVGTARLAVGFLKIFVVSTLFERTAAWAWAGGEAPWWSIWIAVLAYGAYFYANFSGYSDVAIGLARLWGFKLKENFANPFLKTNPQAFWASWHMSLTRWAQRNIFVPAGGMRANRQYVAIFLTIMVIALWHGLDWTLVIFGLYHAAIVIGHRLLESYNRQRGNKPSSNPGVRAAKMFAVFTYVSLSIPLFHLSTQEIIPFYLSLLPGR